MTGRPIGSLYIHPEYTPEGEPDGVTIEDAGYHTVRLNKDECLEVGITLIEARSGKFFKELQKDVNHSVRSVQSENSKPSHIGDWPAIQRQDLI